MQSITTKLKTILSIGLVSLLTLGFVVVIFDINPPSEKVAHAQGAMGIAAHYASASGKYSEPVTIGNVVVSGDVNLLIFTFEIRGSGYPVSVTRDGQTFTREKWQRNGDTRAGIYYLKNPKEGTSHVVVDLNAMTTMTSGVTAINNGYVGAGSPFSNSAIRGGSSGYSHSITVNSAPGELVIEATSHWRTTVAPVKGAGQVRLHMLSGGGNHGGTSSWTSGASPSVTTSWSGYSNSTSWTAVSGSIKPYVPPITCIDNDSDGYGSPADSSCTYNSLDCDDTNSGINPGATEVCGNSIDEDCSGGDLACVPVCIDNDNDGYGSPADSLCTYNSLDCDDTNSGINPGATEICGNSIDEDCSGGDLVCPPPNDETIPEGSVVLGENGTFKSASNNRRILFVSQVPFAFSSKTGLATPSSSGVNSGVEVGFEAAVISQGDIVFVKNDLADDTSIVVEGPLVARTNGADQTGVIDFLRNRGLSNSYPSVVVKYNPIYLTALGSLEIPSLSQVTISWVIE